MKSSQGAEHMETVTPGFPSSCWEWEGRWCCSGCVCGLTCSCLWSNAMGQGDGNGAGGVLLAWVSHTGGGCGLLALCPGGEGDSGTMPVPPCPSGEVSATPRVTNPTSSLCPASEEPPKGAEMAYIPAPPQGFTLISPSCSYMGTSLHPHPCAIWAQHPHPCPHQGTPSPSVHPHPCPSRLNITIPSAQHPDPSIPSPIPPPCPRVPTTLLTPPFAAAFGQQSPSPSAVPRFIRASKAEGWPSRSLLGPRVFTFTLCFEYFPPRSM